MDDKQFDKRMALLKKSYDRMEQKLNPADVLKQIEEEEKEALAKQTIATQKKPFPKWQKPAVWLASIASVLLVGFLVTLYTMKQQENNQTEVPQNIPVKEAEEKDAVDYITKKYNSRKEDIRRELKVSKDELQAFEFIQTADTMLDFYIANNLHSSSIESDSAQNVEEYVLYYLMTPKRAIETIKTYNNLTFDESYEVYNQYVIAVEELENFYSKLLEPFEPLLKNADKKQYPSDLKAIIEAANNQYMELKKDENGSFYFKANPVEGEFAPAYINQLHPDVFGYFEYLKTGYLLLVDDLRYSREETANSLKIMERSLLADINAGSPNYKLLLETFKNTWVALLLGTKKYPVLAEDGQPDKEYITFLQEVAKGKYGEVMKKKAANIFKELQQNNHSETLAQLTAYDIWTILLQTREETAGYINDSDFNIVDMNDSRIEQIKGIYEQYKKHNDIAILNQLRPINIAALYLYAISIGDESLQKTLLMPDSELDISLMLQTMKDIEIFSQLGEYDGIYPIVAARVAISEQDKYGRQFLIKFSKQEEGYYRITEIID
ncbi:hypothetical protein ACIQXW_18285 [Lysinibacillus sp. NPDC097162]|uniref:hypothetical protein n=1 Tax=Lysinibacillus sp. NPDC097162 TaxID=3364140 RepID=UPI003804A7FC